MCEAACFFHSNMKVAITGKGGVGKSTIAGILAHLAKRDGKTVLAVDADPDANLAAALGVPETEREKIIPISQRVDLIEERTGAKLKQFGQIFKLNPDVSDVAERFCYQFEGISILVLGAVEAGGSGCACPENVFLRHLLSHIILHRDEFVIVDMEAGIEHLGRGTAKSIDLMLVVLEPSSNSIATARSIITLAGQIGIDHFILVGNKIFSDSDRAYLTEQVGEDHPLDFIPYSDNIKRAERDGVSPFEGLKSDLLRNFQNLYNKVS